MEGGGLLRSDACQTRGSCCRALLGPGYGHPGDRACLGSAGLSGPLAALFTVAQTPGLALPAPWEVMGGGSFSR